MTHFPLEEVTLIRLLQDEVEEWCLTRWGLVYRACGLTPALDFPADSHRQCMLTQNLFSCWHCLPLYMLSIVFSCINVDHLFNLRLIVSFTKLVCQSASNYIVMELDYINHYRRKKKKIWKWFAMCILEFTSIT